MFAHPCKPRASGAPLHQIPAPNETLSRSSEATRLNPFESLLKVSLFLSFLLHSARGAAHAGFVDCHNLFLVPTKSDSSTQMQAVEV